MEDLVNSLASFWGGRRVFITGHTGFKGGWLALWLARCGAQVRGYALAPPTEPNLFTLARVGNVVDDIRGDILDRPALEAAISAFAPEVVFHMAAQPLVRRSYADPLGTWMTNAMGTAYVLEAVRQNALSARGGVRDHRQMLRESRARTSRIARAMRWAGTIRIRRARRARRSSAPRSAARFLNVARTSRRVGDGARGQCDWRRRLVGGSAGS